MLPSEAFAPDAGKKEIPELESEMLRSSQREPQGISVIAAEGVTSGQEPRYEHAEKIWVVRLLRHESSTWAGKRLGPQGPGG